VSKQRARERAARLAAAEAQAAERAAQRTQQREQAAAARARRDRAQRWWRSVRLWQHGPSFRRNRSTWGALGCVVFGILVVVYLVSHDAGITVVAALVCVIASPLLVTLFFDRSRK
jgi:Flp pilus assembly protein TadB